MLNYFRGLFKQPKITYEVPKGMTREANMMLRILDTRENEWVERKQFLDNKVYNPGRSKSQLVKKHGKCILCKRDKDTSYWMYITNPMIARNNMSESDRRKYTLDHLYNAYTQ